MKCNVFHSHFFCDRCRLQILARGRLLITWPLFWILWTSRRPLLKHCLKVGHDCVPYTGICPIKFLTRRSVSVGSCSAVFSGMYQKQLWSQTFSMNFICPKQLYPWVTLCELYVPKTVSLACIWIWNKVPETTALTCYSVSRTVSLQYYSVWSAWTQNSSSHLFPFTFQYFVTKEESSVKRAGGALELRFYLSLTSCSVASSCQTVISSPRTEIARHCKDWVRG
jgi:hypothetical protein